MHKELEKSERLFAIQHSSRGDTKTRSMSPGWYPDPSGAPGTRFWNGKHWTVSIFHGQPPRKRLVWPWLMAGGFVMFLGGCGALIAIVAPGA
jgi:hypothetical protein